MSFPWHWAPEPRHPAMPTTAWCAHHRLPTGSNVELPQPGTGRDSSVARRDPTEFSHCHIRRLAVPLKKQCEMYIWSRLPTARSPPPWYGSPGSTPFPSICKLLAAFLRSRLVFVRFLQRFWLPASHLLGTCYLFDDLRSTHTPSKYLRATYSYIYTCYVSTSNIYIYIYTYIHITYIYILYIHTYTYIYIYIYYTYIYIYVWSTCVCRRQRPDAFFFVWGSPARVVGSSGLADYCTKTGRLPSAYCRFVTQRG